MSTRNVMHMAVLLTYLVSLLILTPAGEGVAAPASPQVATGTFLSPEVKISPLQTPDANRLSPAVAYNSKHKQYLVVWYNQWQASFDIYAQRVGSSGQLAGGWFSVTSGPNNRLCPAVAYNETDDEYLVVYMYDASGNGTHYDIMGQRLSWDGNKLGGAFQIATATTDTSNYVPKVVWKQSYDEYLVVWSIRDPAGVPNSIGEMLIDNLGARRYGTILASENHPDGPDLVWEPLFNRYLVVWSYTNAAGHTAIMGDLRNSDANRVVQPGLTNPFVVYSSDTNDALHPRVISDGALYLAVYEYAYSPTDHDIYGTWVTSDTALTIPVQLVYSGASETLPAVASNRNHETMLLYERQVPGRTQVMLHPLIASPTDIPVCDFTSWTCGTPALAWGAPGYMLTYAARYLNLAWPPMVFGRLLYANTTFVPVVKR